MKPETKAIRRIHRKIDRATTEIEQELRRAFPKGTRAKFLMHSGQKNPSSGVIVGGYLSFGYPYVSIKLDVAKSWRRRVRRVPYELVLELGEKVELDSIFKD